MGLHRILNETPPEATPPATTPMDVPPVVTTGAPQPMPPVPQIPYPAVPPTAIVPAAKTWLQEHPWVAPVGGGVAALLLGLTIGLAVGRRGRRPTY